MKKYLLFTILLIGAGLCIKAQPANINLSGTAAFEGEPYLAVNPTNPQNIVVAWMADDLATGLRMSIRSKVSFDGGTTWGNQYIQPHFGATWYSADVSIQFRNNGTLYLSYIDYHQAPDSGGVYITHSVDGGISWSAPTQVWNGITEDPTKRPLDRPWLVADNSGTPTDGMLYITTKPAPWITPPNRPYLKTSADSGQTWSAYRYIDTLNYLVGNLIAAPMAAPAVTADGALCLAYPSYLPSQSIYPKVLLAKSYSRGATFSYCDLLVNAVGLSTADSSYKAGYPLAANPVNANQLAFAYLDNRNGDPDVYITTTNDGGITWGTTVRVNDDAIGNGVGQDMCWLSYNTSGNLVAVWRDRRNGSGTGFAQSTDTYCAVSTDNGLTFHANVRMSNLSAPYNTVLLQSGNDFMSCKLINDTVNVAWGDMRSAHMNIYFAKTSALTGSGSGISIVNNEDEMFTVYPNPAKDKITIIANIDNNKENIIFNIADAQGKIVYQSEIKNKQTIINVSNLSEAEYFCNMIANDKKYVQKLLITK